MPKPGKSALGTRLLLPLTRPSNPLNVKISFFKQSLLWVRKYSIYYSCLQNRISHHKLLARFKDTWNRFTQLHRITLFVHEFSSLHRTTCYCCGCLYYCTCSFRKKETHLFLTTEWRVVQSSWSILEQYMGRWPKAIIQGLLARFSGLFASLRSFVNHSTCSATAPLVK